MQQTTLAVTAFFKSTVFDSLDIPHTPRFAVAIDFAHLDFLSSSKHIELATSCSTEKPLDFQQTTLAVAEHFDLAVLDNLGRPLTL